MFDFFSFTHCSTSLLTITAGEKFIYVYFPMLAKQVCTVRNAKKACAVIAIIFALFDSQWFFLAKDTGGKSCGTINQNVYNYYNGAFMKIHATIYSYIPLSLMALFNIAIIIKLYIARQQAREGKVNTNTMSKAARSVTIMLISVSILFMIFTFPYAIVYNGQLRQSFSGVTRAVVILLMYTNHAVNIVVYCAANRKFRRELLRMVCGWRGQDVYPDETVSTLTAVTVNNKT